MLQLISLPGMEQACVHTYIETSQLHGQRTQTKATQLNVSLESQGTVLTKITTTSDTTTGNKNMFAKGMDGVKMGLP